MARLQILQLPEGASDERAPFVLVIDQYEATRVGPKSEWADQFDGVAAEIGARAVLVFEETIDIPANEVPIGADGYPLRVRVEPDFEQFREQVQAEIHATNEQVTASLHDALRRGGSTT